MKKTKNKKNKETQDFSTSISERNESVYLFIPFSQFVSFRFFIYKQYFLDVVRNNLQAKYIYKS